MDNRDEFPPPTQAKFHPCVHVSEEITGRPICSFLCCPALQQLLLYYLYLNKNWGKLICTIRPVFFITEVQGWFRIERYNNKIIIKKITTLLYIASMLRLFCNKHGTAVADDFLWLGVTLCEHVWIHHSHALMSQSQEIKGLIKPASALMGGNWKIDMVLYTVD